MDSGLTNYQIWQKERYGNIIDHTPTECETENGFKSAELSMEAAINRAEIELLEYPKNH